MAMATASLTMLVQVFCRYVLSAPIAWAEELTVLLFAWLIFLGSAFVQRSDSHLSIDSLRRIASPRVGVALDILRLATVALCSLVLIWQGYQLAMRTLPLLYPAMGVSRAWLYASVPVCFAIGLGFLAADVVERLKGNATVRSKDS